MSSPYESCGDTLKRNAIGPLSTQTCLASVPAVLPLEVLQGGLVWTQKLDAFDSQCGDMA